MTVTELAERVRKPRGTVAHHVDVLVDAGLLKVTATRRVRAIDERFYGRTAHTIVFPDSATDGDLPFVADARAEADLSDASMRRRVHAAARPDPGGAGRRVRRAASMDLAMEFTRLPRGGHVSTRSSPASSPPTAPLLRRIRE